MKTDKVTREDLRAIHDGETRTFELPTYSAVLSARSLAYSTGRTDGCRFTYSVEPDRNVIAITRMPR